MDKTTKILIPPLSRGGEVKISLDFLVKIEYNTANPTNPTRSSKPEGTNWGYNGGVGGEKLCG